MDKHMVDLGMKESEFYGSIPQQGKRKDKTVYPSFSVRKDVGISEDDAGKEITAICMLKVIEVAKEATEKGKKSSAKFEVKGLNLKPGKTSHYKTS